MGFKVLPIGISLFLHFLKFLYCPPQKKHISYCLIEDFFSTSNSANFLVTQKATQLHLLQIAYLYLNIDYFLYNVYNKFMITENIISQLCILLQLNSQFPGNACYSTLNATSKQTKTEQTINLAENYYEKKFYSVVDKEYVYGVGALGAGYNAYKTREIKVSTPLKPICNELSFDLTDTSKTYNVNWIWKW